MKGEGKASRDSDQQENEKEFEEEKEELETKEELSPSFSTYESRRQNLLEKVYSLFLLFCKILLENFFWPSSIFFCFSSLTHLVILKVAKKIKNRTSLDAKKLGAFFSNLLFLTLHFLLLPLPLSSTTF